MEEHCRQTNIYVSLYLAFCIKRVIYQRFFETRVAVLIEVSVGVHFKQAVMWKSMFTPRECLQNVNFT